MAIVQPIKNGKVVDPTGSAADNQSQNNKAKKSGSSLDKEAFLQLLVAQMKYQDPLQPTDNTEYVAQLATFAQLEETQNQTNELRGQTAGSLVGKNVVVHTTNAGTGEVSEDAGTVEYVQRENNKVYVYVNGTKYNYDDIYQVLDDTYLDAMSVAKQFSDLVDLLPSVSDCSVSHKSQVDAAVKNYNSMTSYQQGFVPKETTDKLQALADKIKKMQGTEENTNKTEKTEETKNNASDSKKNNV